MKVSGPLVTLGAVATVGVALLAVNMSKENSPTAPPAAPPAASSTSAAATTTTSTTPTPPPPAPFPAKADYVGKINTSTGVITLDIAVSGQKAVAYACDGKSVETWLTGPAEAGTVTLTNKNKTSRLEGRHEGTNVSGTLTIGEKSWPFTAAAVQPPAGLYLEQAGGVRNSWIVDADKSVTGVQRAADGATSPAPALPPNATRVEGDSDVF
ncbi:hypothetical protein EB75_20630 [Mycobacterium sp. ST-F2]|uniref:hypothetical protein n=1 Tax=Mycobacterium sp. ST-F2 TaxID=1490484 RepID=UPI00093A5F7C|nr:hypothetical protein [Mycobacterium sp. ST-F2]OKH80446.1 hypothetical protein EB75_20630 [Mycobacterium sp. ST-F2]